MTMKLKFIHCDSLVLSPACVRVKNPNHTLSQAVCTYGRENFESWGRKKRDVSKRAVDNSADTAMSLSREIIVLDFGDEGTNPYDFDKPSKSSLSNGNCKK